MRVVRARLKLPKSSCSILHTHRELIQPWLHEFKLAFFRRSPSWSRLGTQSHCGTRIHRDSASTNRIFFDDTGALVDAGVTTYLLESSRVVSHAERERISHRFSERDFRSSAHVQCCFLAGGKDLHLVLQRTTKDVPRVLRDACGH